MIVKEGQSIYDVCLQEFGTLENMSDLILENELNFNSKLKSGQQINVDNIDKGSSDIKSFTKTENIVYNNAQVEQLPPLAGGAYDGSYGAAYS